MIRPQGPKTEEQWSYIEKKEPMLGVLKSFVYRSLSTGCFWGKRTLISLLSLLIIVTIFAKAKIFLCKHGKT